MSLLITAATVAAFAYAIIGVLRVLMLIGGLFFISKSLPE